ncbi:hypothetical protein NECAME_08184 [Necator americanus]|uniref:Protein kinase domain-containing protein n=1 Tax=Necator americanus TaxID=51031 RepID=W2TJ01_NECAM|nr:hypothetical protein NECAME_08184 [Necator americanus]ETN82085.1 hypothetical protein NECAME_08184 [Necator americanus]
MAETSPIIIQLDIGKAVDKYTVAKKLGEGTFAAVYAVQDAKGNKYALKAESVNEKIPLLRLELFVMQRLQAKNAVHMADLIDKGRVENFNYIVMKLLGKSLQVAKKTGPDRHLSLGPAIGCAIQCLEALEELHWIGFLHRDVKPGNFAIGRAETGELRKLFILDFGMCRRFYMLIDFTNAKLPWKGTTDIRDVIFEALQIATNFLESVSFKPIVPHCSYIDGLTFFDEPNYDMIYMTLREAMKKKGVSEFPYDWEKENVISS